MSTPVLKPEESRWSKYLVRLREVRAVAFAVFLLLVFLVLAVYIHLSGTSQIDKSISHSVQTLRSPGMDRVMEDITNLGNFAVVGTIAILGALLLFILGKHKSAFIALLSLISYPANVLIKDTVDRVRPQSSLVQIIVPAGGFSFPSGHAMLTMSVYGTLTALFWIYLRAQWRGYLVAFSALIIFIVGFSRVYLGVHWFTDVTGGWIAGLFIVVVCMAIHARITREAVLTEPTPRS